MNDITLSPEATVRVYKNGKASVDHEGVKIETQLMADNVRIKVTVRNKIKNTGYVNYATADLLKQANDPHYVLTFAKEAWAKERGRNE